MRIISKTLLLLLIVALLPAFSVADNYESLNRAENLLVGQEKKTWLAARRVDKAHTKMTELGNKYSASQSITSQANTQSVAAAFGVTVQVFAAAATSGASAAVSAGLSGIAGAVITTSMTTAAEKEAALRSLGATSLVDAYESAIREKASAVKDFEGQVVNYQINWQVWSAVYNGHYDWDTHEGAGSQAATHTYHDYIDDWHVDTSLPSFPCGGKCGHSFITPKSDHWVQCGYRRNILEHPEYIRRTSEGEYPERVIPDLLKDRPAAEGCGRHYYNCRDEAEHKLRTCNKPRVRYEGDYLVTKPCGIDYRRCMGKKMDHDPSDGNPFKAPHFDTFDSSSTTTQQTTAPDSQVDNSPNCEHCTNSCSACTQPTTPAMHPCGIHATSVSGDHSLQASCSLSNNWMRTCTVTNFYACQTHTCVFPTFQCGRASCTQAVADPNEHRRTCINGHNYWSCNTSPLNGVEYHKTRTCTRRKVRWKKWIRHLGTYRGVWGTCGESYANCNAQSCMDLYRAVGRHQE
ncbi:MAG: hypothetical protein OXI43_00655 [Candidatus Poribacteria bacterium]|nr:hypothetical protein [Candidatus Poribacteria bacterium]